jgi:hypothetical protein
MKQELFKAAYIIIIVLTMGFIIACCVGIMIDRVNPVSNTVSVSTPVYVDETTVSEETSPLTDTITYQVESMSKNNYQVVTTNGDVLYFDNYNEWDTQVKRCVYTVKVTGRAGMAYLVRHPRVEVAYVAPNEKHSGMYVAS